MLAVFLVLAALGGASSRSVRQIERLWWRHNWTRRVNLSLCPLNPCPWDDLVKSSRVRPIWPNCRNWQPCHFVAMGSRRLGGWDLEEEVPNGTYCEGEKPPGFIWHFGREFEILIGERSPYPQKLRKLMRMLMRVLRSRPN